MGPSESLEDEEMESSLAKRRREAITRRDAKSDAGAREAVLVIDGRMERSKQYLMSTM
jgi:hypothetical protein